MNVTIEIHYKASSKLMQRASLPLRGKRPEFVAYHWWKQIQKEMSYHAALEQVTVKQLTPRITIPKVN
ncbi:hypothetical protein J7E81_08975 [Bacillus sp. ISL-18]|uniref:hypothetical protein n=1 Tax=Bacillus sp. ISL-18 TaxID=2819118 RepID=UPI001BE5C400|nr:hypothetical protein [Bacillus sp. ISL-18]MBT2655368.1 hypothetical protein [Bacillus sp. ISL-18]